MCDYAVYYTAVVCSICLIDGRQLQSVYRIRATGGRTLRFVYFCLIVQYKAVFRTVRTVSSTYRKPSEHPEEILAAGALCSTVDCL